MVGDSYVARQHGIQYCQAGDPFVGENECACFKCENTRLQARVTELETALRDAIEECARVADRRASIARIAAREVGDQLAISPQQIAAQAAQQASHLERASMATFIANAIRALPRSQSGTEDRRDAPKAFFHQAWGYAKEHPEQCADGYDKQAFGHVHFWLDQLLAHRKRYRQGNDR